MAFCIGIPLAGSDGAWFPYANIAGIVIFALPTAVAAIFGE